MSRRKLPLQVSSWLDYVELAVRRRLQAKGISFPRDLTARILWARDNLATLLIIGEELQEWRSKLPTYAGRVRAFLLQYPFVVKRKGGKWQLPEDLLPGLSPKATRNLVICRTGDLQDKELECLVKVSAASITKARESLSQKKP